MCRLADAASGRDGHSKKVNVGATDIYKATAPSTTARVILRSNFRLKEGIGEF